MKIHRLDKMTKGWFVGPFTPTALHTEDFEVAVKEYTKGDTELKHVHKVATEYTLLLKGRVIMNGNEYKAGEIIEIEPGEPTDFNVLEDATTVVVKVPAVLGDKYEC